MKILIDTNIILDIALERKPFVTNAIMILKMAQEKNIEIYMTATTVTDLYYISRKVKGREMALSFIKDLMIYFHVASVDKQIILDALHSGFSDFEDGIQVCSAKNENITRIITRNEKDFQNSGMTVYNPEAFLKSFS